MMRKSKSNRTEENESESLARPETTTPVSWFDQVDRWFDEFRQDFEERFWSPLARLDESALRVREPLVDLVDNGSEFIVRAELPGVKKEDVDIEVTDDRIEIRAEADRSREEKEKDYFFRERTYQSLYRVLPFPAEVKPDLALATVKDGLLEVRVPKKKATQESKAVKVRVQ
ncbi:MAG TPA: Hsp20/alpha crystallin family protein [Thermoplasmata archaeon]|nr:Hsp20/alpha crystallin family protein [Thermoplasmata archaeon]